jgi:hypothetical protein
MIWQLAQGKHNKTRSTDELKEYLKQGIFEPRWNPALEEYRKELKEELQETIRSYPGRICLTVRVKRNAPFKEIEKELIAFFKEEFYKARPYWNKYGVWFYPKEAHGPEKGKNGLVINRIRKDELERYLEVYRLFHEEGKSWRQTAALVKFYSKRTFNDDVERQLQNDRDKAKNIIKNIEKGSFPGKY